MITKELTYSFAHSSLPGAHSLLKTVLNDEVSDTTGDATTDLSSSQKATYLILKIPAHQASHKNDRSMYLLEYSVRANQNHDRLLHICATPQNVLPRSICYKDQ